MSDKPSKEAIDAANALAQTLHMELEDEACRADRDDIARALDAFAAERVADLFGNAFTEPQMVQLIETMQEKLRRIRGVK